MKPATQYARSGDLHIAYQVLGEAGLDIVLVRGYATHMDLSWEWPGFRRMMDRLRLFARVILFDKRGTASRSQRHDESCRRQAPGPVGVERPRWRDRNTSGDSPTAFVFCSRASSWRAGGCPFRQDIRVVGARALLARVLWDHEEVADDDRWSWP